MAPHGDRLAAVFPGTFTLAGSAEVQGGVFFALSEDGRTFSTPVRLLRSRVFPYLFSRGGGDVAPRTVLSARTADHPSGWERVGGTTHVTIEVNVTGIGASPATGADINTELLQRDLAAHKLTGAVPALCRYALETAALERAAAAAASSRKC